MVGGRALVMPFLAAACAAGNPESATVCEVVAQPAKYDGTTIEGDVTFTSDSIEHVWLLPTECPGAAPVAVDSNLSASGDHGLFWQLNDAYRASTPGRWYGVAARARMKVRSVASGLSISVLRVSGARRVTIPAPPPAPPLRSDSGG